MRRARRCCCYSFDTVLLDVANLPAESSREKSKRAHASLKKTNTLSRYGSYYFTGRSCSYKTLFYRQTIPSLFTMIIIRNRELNGTFANLMFSITQVAPLLLLISYFNEDNISAKGRDIRNPKKIVVPRVENNNIF